MQDQPTTEATTASAQYYRLDFRERTTNGIVMSAVFYRFSGFLEDSTMDALSQQLSERVGLDEGTAEKVSTVLQGNMGDMQGLLAGDGRGLVQLLQKAGINEGVAQKVVAFLKENSGQLSEWASKAKEMLGGILARKGEE
jgi:hypothetical protein